MILFAPNISGGRQYWHNFLKLEIFTKPRLNSKVRVEKMKTHTIWAKFIEGEQNYQEIATENTGSYSHNEKRVFRW